MTVQSCHNTGPCGAASGAIVELGKLQSIVGEAIDMWRFDLPSLEPQIRIAEIVHQDDEYVRTILSS